MQKLNQAVASWIVGARRTALWARLAGDLRPNGLDKIATDEVGLDGLEPALDRVLAGGNKGRTVVRLGGG